MKNPKTLVVVVLALVMLAVGFLFMRSPKPIIEIKAETITEFGPFPLVNTYVTSLTVVILLAIVAFLATRNITLIPGKLQNVVEAVMDALYTICINTAGEKNGRRFFPVILTIFVFIWVANWMALLPFFNAIGRIERVSPEEFHHEAVLFDKGSTIGLIMPNQKEIEFEEEGEAVEVEARAVHDLESEIEEARSAGAAAEEIEELEVSLGHAEESLQESAILAALKDKGEIPETTASWEEAEEYLKEHDKQLGILIPFFRSMNTDINSPLSIAIMAMIFIEFWGITGLGVFKYMSKFFTLSSPINFFVGILEFIAEIARLISFSFRLFGNMLAGEILLLVMTFLAPFLVAVPFYALETFVGIIQAFVFAMLTLVFATLAVSSHDDHDEHHGDEGDFVQQTGHTAEAEMLDMPAAPAH